MLPRCLAATCARARVAMNRGAGVHPGGRWGHVAGRGPTQHPRTIATKNYAKILQKNYAKILQKNYAKILQETCTQAPLIQPLPQNHCTLY